MIDENASPEELEALAEELGRKAEENPDALSDEEWQFLEDMAARDDVPAIEAVAED